MGGNSDKSGKSDGRGKRHKAAAASGRKRGAAKKKPAKRKRAKSAGAAAGKLDLKSLTPAQLRRVLAASCDDPPAASALRRHIASGALAKGGRISLVDYAAWLVKELANAE